MDIRLLEDALLLLEERNLSAAAERRNMTQPAFSRRIRALEDWLGKSLLVRHANRVELTPTLAANEAQIRGLLRQLRQLRDQMRGEEKTREILHFVSQHSLSVSVFPEIYRTLDRLGRAISARLHTRNLDAGMAMFLRHEADVLLSYEMRDFSQLPFDQSVARHTWRRDAMVPVVGGSLRHLLTEDLRLRQGSPVIGYPTDSQFGRFVAAYESKAEQRLDGVLAVESAFSVGIAELVLAGVGAAWVPHSLLHEEICSGEAVILSASYGRVPLDIALYAHASSSHTATLVADLVR